MDLLSNLAELQAAAEQYANAILFGLVCGGCLVVLVVETLAALFGD